MPWLTRMRNLSRIVESDGRSPVKRKWLVDKRAGPLVLFSELVQKKLLHHAWPVEYEITGDVSMFLPQEGFLLGSSFDLALSRAVIIVSGERRVIADASGRCVCLRAEYWIDERGRFRDGEPPVPF